MQYRNHHKRRRPAWPDESAPDESAIDAYCHPHSGLAR